MRGSGGSRISARADQAAFSLIELMIAITILAIGAGLALPSFREAGINNNVSSLTNSLVADLNTARIEAVKRGIPAGVIQAAGGWRLGWTVRFDSNKDGSITTADTVLINRPTAPAGYLVGGLSIGGGSSTLVSFTAVGAVTNQFVFGVCRPDGLAARARRIDISITGVVASRRALAGAPVAPCT